jgi:hypothetical protein
MFGYVQNEPTSLINGNILLAVGSIMRMANENAEVWGSGIRNIDQSDFRGARAFHAVRGLFSRDRILDLGLKCPPIYGDPGLLISDYYMPKVNKKYKLGVIPHIVDFNKLNSHFKDVEGVKIINLKSNNIENIIEQILECEHIISTSLHGIITAVAYKIPVRWLKCSNNLNGDDIKFYDFFSSLDHDVFNLFNRKSFKAHKNYYNPLLFDPRMEVSELCEQTHLFDLGDFDKDKLLNACPFNNYSNTKIDSKLVSPLGKK